MGGHLGFYRPPPPHALPAPNTRYLIAASGQQVRALQVDDGGAIRGDDGPIPRMIVISLELVAGVVAGYGGGGREVQRVVVAAHLRIHKVFVVVAAGGGGGMHKGSCGSSTTIYYPIHYGFTIQ